jgi:hypothetical protein
MAAKPSLTLSNAQIYVCTVVWGLGGEERKNNSLEMKRINKI